MEGAGQERLTWARLSARTGRIPGNLRYAGRRSHLKGVDERGFVFYTNLWSRKALALAANPYAALTFYWPPLDKQVRVEGDVERVSEADADAYFATRPRASQIGAWASTQSASLASPASLDERVRDVRDRFDGAPVFQRRNGEWERSLLFP